MRSRNRTIARLAQKLNLRISSLRQRITPVRLAQLQQDPRYQIRPPASLRPRRPGPARGMDFALSLPIEVGEEILKLAFELDVPPTHLVRSWLCQIVGVRPPAPKWHEGWNEELQRLNQAGVLSADFSGHAPHPEVFKRTLDYRLRGASWTMIVKLIEHDTGEKWECVKLQAHFWNTIEAIETRKLQPKELTVPDVCASIIPLAARRKIVEEQQKAFPPNPKPRRRSRVGRVERKLALQKYKQQTEDLDLE